MGIAALGTQVRRNGSALSEVRDVTPPPLTRKSYEKTRWRQTDDEHQMGKRNVGVLQFETNASPASYTSELTTAWFLGSQDTYQVVYSDGAIWSFTGRILLLALKSPIEGALRLQVLIQPDLGISFSTLAEESLITTEDDDQITTESGDSIEIE